ncbi:MAG TPA: hypothetical protein VFO08_13965, partial [Methylomirabilota bacterium]|nr:hypothetical protein [Methylomirabilota bacterium]
GRPLYWAPLGWGEPVIRWWGGPRFVGVAWWGGWGGPRVVNNVVINRTTTVNVTNITVYRNVSVTNAVVGVPAERFGHPGVRPVRLADASEVRQLAPVRGAPDVRPVAASLAAGAGPAATRPPEAVRSRAVVATRAPRDPSPALRSQGLAAAPAAGPQAQQRIVPAPARTVTPQAAPPGATPRAPGAAGRSAPGDGPRRDRGRGGLEGHGQPAPPGGAARETGPSRQALPPAPPGPGVQSAPSGAPGGRRPAPAERPGRVEGPGRGNPERGAVERGGDKGGPRGERDR